MVASCVCAYLFEMGDVATVVIKVIIIVHKSGLNVVGLICEASNMPNVLKLIQRFTCTVKTIVLHPCNHC